MHVYTISIFECKENSASNHPLSVISIALIKQLVSARKNKERYKTQQSPGIRAGAPGKIFKSSELGKMQIEDHLYTSTELLN